MKNITFINAGAGSGKTHTLTEILADWVRKNKGNANKVMLTTFTKKAAREIQERTQSKLLENKLFYEASQLQEAYVGTLHSVGYQFIRKYWYLIDSSPELNEINEHEQEVFFLQAIASVPSDEQLETLSEIVEDFNMQSFDGAFDTFNPLKWKNDVLDVMNMAVSNNIALENEESLNISKKKIEVLIKGGKSISEAQKLFKEAYTLICENPANNNYYKEALKILDGLAEKFESGKIKLKHINEWIKILNKIKKYAFKGNKYEEIKNILPEIQAEEFDIFKFAAISYTELIFDIAKKSLEEYKNFKQEKGLVDYTDMEVSFLKLLDIELVKREIKESLKLIMVDEFQDSNPIQLSIFIKLSNLVEQSYWVGDPKQAIYGFRGTDPVLIDAVINEFTKPNIQNLNIEVLKMSWRSAPSLVEFSNTIFSKRMQSQVKDVELLDRDQLRGDEKFQPFIKWKNEVAISPLIASETISLIPRRAVADFKVHGSHLKFWFFNMKSDKGLKNFEGEKFNSKFTQKIKQLINSGLRGDIKVFDKDKKEERNLVGSDICILIRANANVNKFASQLKSEGIPVNAEVSELDKTIEFRLLYNVISLVANKNSALASTELAYLCGEEEDLYRLIEKRLNFVIPLLEENENGNNEVFYKNLAEWLSDAEHLKLIDGIRSQSKRLSVSQTVQLIINQFNLFQKLLQFNHSKLRMNNLLKLKELAIDYESYCVRLSLGSSLSGFFTYLEFSKEHKKQASACNENAVNVMTYHKAKGLEWPLVILMDLHNNPLDDSFYKKEYFKSRAINTLPLEVGSPLNNRAVEFSFWPFGKAPINEKLKNQIDESEDGKDLKIAVSNEASRLMYVGITRARDYLYFTTNQVRNLSWLSNILPSWDFENTRNLKLLNEVSFSKVDLFDVGQSIDFENIKPDDVIEILEVESKPENRIYVRKYFPQYQNNNYYINPSKMSAAKDIDVSISKEIHNRLPVKTSDSTALGNALHQFLYIKDRSYFKKQVENSMAFDQLKIDRDAFILNTEKFKQWISNHCKVLKQYSEFSMEVEIGNQLAVGEADLVVETKDGLILIDYKSYAGSDDVTNASCEYFAGKYSGQLNMYTQMLEKKFENKKVLKKLIYYVVQGKIVELT